MSQNYLPLVKDIHATLTYSAVRNVSSFVDINAVPLVGVEVAQAARFFPVVFLPAARGALQPHALFGLDSRNIFVTENGEWTAGYMPLFVANYPFSLVELSGGDASTPQWVLAVDVDAPHFQGQHGESLFDAQGNLVGVAKRAVEVLSAQREHHILTINLMAEVEKADVMGDTPLTVTLDGNELSIGGLRHVNREKVMALPDATLADWTRRGMMEILFAHWSSLQNLEPLVRAAAAAQQTASSMPQ